MAFRERIVRRTPGLSITALWAIFDGVKFPKIQPANFSATANHAPHFTNELYAGKPKPELYASRVQSTSGFLPPVGRPRFCLSEIPSFSGAALHVVLS